MVPVLFAAVRHDGEILEVGRRSEIDSYVDCYNRRTTDTLAQVSTSRVVVRLVRVRGRVRREVARA